MKAKIEELIKDFVKGYKEINNTETSWRTPLIGFADSNNELFCKFKEMIDENYLLPCDILSDSKTVVSYFIPFTKEMVKTNIGGKIPSRQWAVAYIETNKLLGDLGEYLIKELDKFGVKANMPKFPSPGFNSEKVISYWSQRHVAYAAGLGTFGINNMLITDEGCCGRFGSIVTNCEVEYNPLLKEERCLYIAKEICSKCIDNCPSKALTVNEFDRHKCYELLLENDKMFSDLELSEVCGKCIVNLPCSFSKPNLSFK